MLCTLLSRQFPKIENKGWFVELHNFVQFETKSEISNQCLVIHQ